MKNNQDDTIKRLEKRIRKLEKQKSIGITKYDIFRFLCVVGSAGMAYLSYLFLMFTWNFLEIGEFIAENLSQPQHLLILFPVLLIYLFISLTAISAVALHKKGFKNLKKYDEEGLILGLIVCLIPGLIGGLMFGLIFGMILGLILGLIVCLIPGLIVGLIFGLILGLIVEYE